jgi:hypothetical protein
MSPEWFEEVLTVVGDRTVGLGVAAEVQCEITGGPEGDLVCHWVIEEGRLTKAGLGQAEKADVVLTVAWSDATSIQRGDLDPNVAFMQGRLKVAGSMGAMLDLLKWVRTGDGRTLVERVAEATQF